MAEFACFGAGAQNVGVGEGAWKENGSFRELKKGVCCSIWHLNCGNCARVVHGANCFHDQCWHHIRVSRVQAEFSAHILRVRCKNVNDAKISLHVVVEKSNKHKFLLKMVSNFDNLRPLRLVGLLGHAFLAMKRPLPADHFCGMVRRKACTFARNVWVNHWLQKNTF